MKERVENEEKLLEIINNVERIVAAEDCAAYYSKKGKK